MGLSDLQSLNDWVTFAMSTISTMVTGIGVMTVSEKVAQAGLMWFTNAQGSKQHTTIWKHAQAHEWVAM